MSRADTSFEDSVASRLGGDVERSWLAGTINRAELLEALSRRLAEDPTLRGDDATTLVRSLANVAPPEEIARRRAEARVNLARFAPPSAASKLVAKWRSAATDERLKAAALAKLDPTLSPEDFRLAKAIRDEKTYHFHSIAAILDDNADALESALTGGGAN